MQPTRRTQQSRREETIGKLVDSSIECLLGAGYHGTSVQMICARAGLSQGALFRHFPTKNELMVLVGRRVVDRVFDHAIAQAEKLPLGMGDEERILALMREVTMSPCHTVLLELMMAARTTPELGELMQLRSNSYYRDRLIAMMARFFPRYAASSGFFAMVLTLMSTFHGMALYRACSRQSGPADPVREQWMLRALHQELSRLADEGGDLRGMRDPEYQLPFDPRRSA